METLGDDLVLLSIRSDGAIGTGPKLRFGLSGAELVRLAALRRVNIDHGRIVVLDKTPTGDVFLDEALHSMSGGRRPPGAKAWVAHKRGDLALRYLERLARDGTIGTKRRMAMGLIPSTGWAVLNAGRMDAARARLDATEMAVDATRAVAAATDAATRAATEAAVQASIDAATQAAVSAATHAAHDAAGHAGHAGGGHH